ncbi:MAG: hypothetical protein AAGF07_04040 [Patescibacteria group bacterium]
MKFSTVFSILLLLLLTTSLGLNIYTQYQLSESSNKHKQDISALEDKIIVQQQARDDIRKIWENQAVINDKLIIAQELVDQKTDAYTEQIKKSIRFINTTPQLLPGANEKELLNAEQELLEARENLEAIIEENAEQKAENKNQVDTIYLDLNEDQNNRANPREGTR